MCKYEKIALFLRLFLFIFVIYVKESSINLLNLIAMQPSLVYLLIWLCGLIAFVSLLGVIFFWLRKKKNAYIIAILVFVLFTLLAAYFAIDYVSAAEVIAVNPAG